ncbi:Alpha/Beta hydrolase fold [Phytophthora cactorum]|nr:Alpha/Beta hydrolase fold [Phytophthora cactorum]
MKAGYQPYGRVSSRGDVRRGAGWDLRVAVLMVFPVICLVVVLYEFLYLQEYAASGAAVDAPVEDRSLHLRADKEAAMTATLVPEPTDPPSIVNGRSTIILVLGDTALDLRQRGGARQHQDKHIRSDLPAEKERQCVDVFCELVGEEFCRRSQIVSSQIDAVNATGPTAARYETEKAITDEDFCMTIDSHLVFIPNWDEKIIAQWDSLANPNAIISVYPKSTEHLTKHDVDDKVQLMCMSRIETQDPDSMVQYAAPMWINKKDTPKPRLMSQLAGGFNFGGCKQAKEVRNDPYTPYLFHGEEYSRATRLWTAGYDFYVPSEDIAYHWYEKRKVVWERDWSERYVIQQPSKRRIRYNLKLPVTKEDFDRTDLDKFTLGTKRTFEQWKNFSGIDPLAKFVSNTATQFNNCLFGCRKPQLQSMSELLPCLNPDHYIFDSERVVGPLNGMTSCKLRSPRRVALALALLAYVRNTGRNLCQQHALLQQNEPRLPLSEHVHAALKYTTTGQLIASSEYLLCLIKPQLAARVGRLLVWTPRDCRLNCRYGPHERNTLDVYGVQEQEETTAAKPVLVFMHGGAWSFGHKWQYALVGEYLATQGFLAAVINYRTFPNGSVVDMIEDIENAVFWVAENCSSLGGDRSKLFLSGHSSGGHVGALALVNSAVRLGVNDPKEREIANYVRGFIGLSAPYDISDHYIFESERVVGVHEISSMKPAMLGMGNFKRFSPTALVAEARNIGTRLLMLSTMMTYGNS